MHLKLLATTALAAGASWGAIATAEEITVVGWGGAYSQSQIEAYHKPFAAATGIKVNSVDAAKGLR